MGTKSARRRTQDVVNENDEKIRLNCNLLNAAIRVKGDNMDASTLMEYSQQLVDVNGLLLNLLEAKNNYIDELISQIDALESISDTGQQE